MPIENPANYIDKTGDWMSFFQNVRRRELSAIVTPEIINEHRDDPRGQETRHSEELQQILNHIHNMPIDGKSFVYVESPNEVYKIGLMHARGVPPTIFQEQSYCTEREAVHAVFLQRIEQFGIVPSREDRP